MLNINENIFLPKNYNSEYSKNGIINGREQQNGHNFIEGKDIILLTCGCFNPPHFGHLRMVKLARDFLEKNFGANVIGTIVSPVSDKYRKKKSTLASSEHRIQMWDLLLKEMGENGWIGVSQWESEQSNWVPIIDVLKHHQQLLDNEHSNAKLIFLCGGDLLIQFLTNKEWNQNELPQILGQFGIVMGTRGTSVLDILANSQWKDICPFLDRLAIFEDDGLPQMSSTQIREAISKGEKNVEEIQEFTAKTVLKYIFKNELYLH